MPTQNPSATGVTAMPLPHFAASVAVGCAIRAATFTFFGNSLVSGRLAHLLQAAVVLLVAVLLPLAFPRPRAWLLHALGNGGRSAPPGGVVSDPD